MSRSNNHQEDDVELLKHELRHRLMNLGQIATATVAGTAKRAVDQLEVSAEKVASDCTQAVVSSLDEVSSRVTRTAQTLDPRPAMRKHPRATLLGGFAAGVLLAMRPQRLRLHPALGIAVELAFAALHAGVARRVVHGPQSTDAQSTWRRPKVSTPELDARG